MVKKLFVGNLAWEVSQADLEKLFEPFGKISSLEIVTDKASGKSRGFGFVEYASEDAAENARLAINGKDFKGRAMRVDYAQDEKK